jgi:hypothetical protein
LRVAQYHYNVAKLVMLFLKKGRALAAIPKTERLKSALWRTAA